MAPKHLKRVVIAASIVVMVGVVTVVVLLMSGGAKSTQHDAPGADLIEIEVRSKPRAHVYYNLRDVGLSPVTLHVPRSDKPIDLAMQLKGKPLIKHVVPDHPQTIDFFVP